MFKSPAFFIGLRYILTRKDNRFISFTSLISMAGLTLGVLALVIVLSVFNGSQGLMRERTLITVPHGNIATAGAFGQWQAAMALVGDLPGVQAVAPYVQTEAMLSEQGYHQVTEIKAVDPALETRVSTLESTMVEGSLTDLGPGEHGIVLGRRLASNLRVQVGDPVNLVVPRVREDNGFALNRQRFTVRGIFDVQFDIGSNLALIHLGDSPALTGAPVEENLRLRLKVDDIHQASAIVAGALALLDESMPGPDYRGEDWSETEASLFNALRMEKVMTSVMLMMIVAIGAFNIISTLVMVVTDKQADIAILRTMGAGEKTVMGIFMVQGVVVGLIGVLLGAAAGIAVVLNFGLIGDLLQSVLAPSDLYMISSLPAVLMRQDVIVVCAVALLISFLATLYPAWRASRIQPAEVLRYE